MEKQGRRNTRWITWVTLVALILAAGLAYWLVRGRQQSPVPSSVSQAVSFKIIYPTRLPQGFTLDKASFQVSNGPVVTYNATNKKNGHIIFSVQPRPMTFDFSSFYAQGLAGTLKFNTDSGEGAVGNNGLKVVGSLVTDTSWALVTADNSSVTTGDIQTTIKNMRQEAN